jgi:hypothetical protein
VQAGFLEVIPFAFFEVEGRQPETFLTVDVGDKSGIRRRSDTGEICEHWIIISFLMSA